MVCQGRTYHFKFFKGCLPQISVCLLLNTLSQIRLWVTEIVFNITIETTEMTLEQFLAQRSKPNSKLTAKVSNNNSISRT